MQNNINEFPDFLKRDISDLINNNFTDEQQLFIIYFNKYKNDQNFSFEHLCRIINRTTNALVFGIISSYRATLKWDLKYLNSRVINHVIEVLLLG